MNNEYLVNLMESLKPSILCSTILFSKHTLENMVTHHICAISWLVETYQTITTSYTIIQLNHHHFEFIPTSPEHPSSSAGELRTDQ
jgi:hypothetical protein